MLGFCKPCHFKCLACNGSKDNQCQNCLHPYLKLGESTCISACPTGMFNNSNLCINCTQEGCNHCLTHDNCV